MKKGAWEMPAWEDADEIKVVVLVHKDRKAPREWRNGDK